MDELVGNTDGFADSGCVEFLCLHLPLHRVTLLCSVSSAIVQRYLSQILDAALSQSPQIQATAIDVLSFTIKQGLAHPLQVSPLINAFEV